MRREDLDPISRLQSVNENFGDALKDIAHYSQSRDKPFEKTAIQTSKYLNRLLTIAETLFPNGLPEKYKSLKKVNKRLYAQRKTEPFEAALQNLENPNVWEELKSLGIQNIENYKGELTDLNLHINQHVRTQNS